MDTQLHADLGDGGVDQSYDASLLANLIHAKIRVPEEWMQ